LLVREAYVIRVMEGEVMEEAISRGAFAEIEFVLH
jgi:hypothetical protein